MEQVEETKIPYRISRFHYTDLACAAMNDPACKEIFDKMEANRGFDIVEHPKPGDFLPDYSVCFMYPHKITQLVFP